jgi:hypothetical protein
MNVPIRYYFWRETYSVDGAWRQLGCTIGYSTAIECKKDNQLQIDYCRDNGLSWTILEALPIDYEV